MFRLTLLILGLALSPAPVLAASHEVSVAEARLAYIAAEYDTALAVLLPAAKAGDPVAQNIVGAAFVDGNGVVQDTTQALQWYARAADQGFEKALHNLGHLYVNGAPGLSPDFTMAAGYYDRAIALGYGASMTNRGLMHELGQGGPIDMDAAVALFDQAADLGDIHAMNNAGQIYVGGKGLGQNLPRALELFNRAAARGDAVAISNLGAMYGNGYVVAQDLVAEKALYLMAAQMGHPQAAINLAHSLIEGPEGLRNLALGYGWCLSGRARALAKDTKEFAEDCDYLASLIDADQRAEGKALAPSLP